MYQNRLRHRDYVGLIQEAEFEVVEQLVTEGTVEDLEVVRRLPINAGFQDYELSELTICDAVFVLTKARR